MKPQLSIVIIGLNEAATLGRSIKSARRALERAGIRGEMFYVDSGSTDHSVQIANALGVAVCSIDRRTANAAKARNAGLQRARGTWVQFIDGDMELDPAWIQFALRTAWSRSLDGVGGRIAEQIDGATIWSRVFGYDWNARGTRAGAVGGTGLWRRSTLSSVGGFDERLSVGEDPDLCRRSAAQGYAVATLDAPMGTHRLGLRNVAAWWKRAVAVGRSAMLIGCRYRDRRLLFDRFGATLLALGFLAWPRLWPVSPLLALAWYLRRIGLDRRNGLPLFEAAAHAAHVSAVRAPLFVGGVAALVRGERS